MGFLSRFIGPTSPDKFAKLVKDRLQHAGDVRQAVYSKETFRLMFSDDGKPVSHLNLRNFYDEFLKLAKDDQDEWWSRVVRGMLPSMDIPDEFEDAKPDIRPIIRTRSYIEWEQVQSQIEGTDFPSIPFVSIGDHLMACLVYDLPAAMIYVNQTQIDEWGVSLYEAMEAARHNLSEIPIGIVSVDNRLFTPDASDGYAASRLLLIDKIEQLPVAGQHGAMAVSRDRLLICGSEDEQGLGMMADLAQKFEGEPRPLCTIPVRLEDGEWRSWIPPAGHPQYNMFKMLALNYLAAEYAQQKQQLDQLHEKQGIDQFVATFTVMQRDEEIVNFAVWARDAITLLPEVDEVFFCSENPEFVLRVTWDDVVRTVGHLMKPDTDRYPSRWLVEEFPTAGQLQEMGAEKI